jgi:CelD/BcsL family acetyltransferase involved in cellulose biosynthesis
LPPIQKENTLMETMTSPLPLHTALLTVAAARDEASLARLAKPWDVLAGDIAFRSATWARNWWRHYRDSRSRLLVLLVADEQGDIVGIAPWFVSRSPGLGRVVRFLGSGEVCSDYLTILAAPEHAPAVAARLADWLAGEGAAEWDLLDLTGVERADPAIGQLAESLADRGHVVDTLDDMSCWRSELPDDWEGFLSSLSKSRRERTRALLRRAIDSGRAIVHRVTTHGELERAFDVLVDLHQKRRQSLSQPGCFASARFTAFHREMAAALLDSGQLRMMWTELEGRPVSAEYSFVGGDTVYYYQGGFEPQLADERPGWLSFAVSLKLAIEEGYRNYDFLRGDESYKASWRATARPLVRVRIVGRQRAARARYSTWRACAQVRAWTRQLFSRIKRS